MLAALSMPHPPMHAADFGRLQKQPFQPRHLGYPAFRCFELSRGCPWRFIRIEEKGAGGAAE